LAQYQRLKPRKKSDIGRILPLFALLGVCTLFVSAAAGDPMDIIVVYDAGIESASDFERTQTYLSGAFLKEFLRPGDTFHLISFSENARIELSRRVEGAGDYRTIIGRLFLLYPLARASSLENAFRYAGEFAADLPPARPKKVVFFSAKPALAAMTAAEAAAGFNELTEVFLAPIPASFETLRSGRALARAASLPEPPALTSAPPPPAPTGQPAPRETPVPRPQPAPRVPAASGNSVNQESASTVTPPVITAADSADTVPFVEAVPRFLDKQSVIWIILPFAALLILAALTFAYILTWEKRIAADTNVQHDFLYRQAKEEQTVHTASDGLLRKASKAAGQPGPAAADSVKAVEPA
jgi:hypothetical protein